MARIYDVGEFEELIPAMSIDNYDEFIAFFVDLGEQWLIDHNIYFERHHIKPVCEGGKDNAANFVCLPYVYHLRAHYLRAAYWQERNQPLLVRKHLYAVQANISQIFHNLDLCDRMLTIPGVLSCASEARKLGFYEQYHKKRVSPIEGKVAVWKGNTQKYVDPLKLDDYYVKGWIKGKKPRKTSKRHKK